MKFWHSQTAKKIYKNIEKRFKRSQIKKKQQQRIKLNRG